MGFRLPSKGRSITLYLVNLMHAKEAVHSGLPLTFAGLGQEYKRRPVFKYKSGYQNCLLKSLPILANNFITTKFFKCVQCYGFYMTEGQQNNRLLNLIINVPA